MFTCCTLLSTCCLQGHAHLCALQLGHLNFQVVAVVAVVVTAVAMVAVMRLREALTLRTLEVIRSVCKC